MTVIVLAMHGAPPKDFPGSELMEFFKLHMALEHSTDGIPPSMQNKHDEMDRKIRQWPRNVENDPFWDASHKLAKELSRVTGHEVVVGFNEFCSPNIDEALEKAVILGADNVIVVTPMMTPGGEHSEVDIPQSIKRAQERHPDASFRYAWPFELRAVATFLAGQLSNH
ncbi:MAG: sirohydrochlorin chelatase [Candidatus Thorarchaeota archaeon]|jgi:sirohydrochlorin cobaltochelatase